MIESIEISNLRGIRHGKIDGLSQVNLFFGKNNCGKSTLLEGLFLVCGQSNPLLPASINAMRTYTRLMENDIHYFFYNMDVAQEIQITATGDQERSLTITSFQEASQPTPNYFSTELSHQYGLRLNFTTKEGVFSSEVLYDLSGENQIKQIVQVDNRYSEKIKCKYLSPRYDSNASMEGLQNIYKNKDEAFLSDALKIIEPKASNPVFMENVMFVDSDLSQRIPINLMGDGIRKIVSFLTNLYACRDGVLLIDELSNGFHYSVMKPMWKLVISAAIKNNVQIFATTHDADSIRGFQQAVIEVMDETKKEIGTGFKLQRITGDELKAYRFSADQLGYAIQQDMEIR